MLIIAKETGKVLYKNYRDGMLPQFLRGLYLPLSASIQGRYELFSNFVQWFETQPEAMHARIYLFADKDIMLFIPGLSGRGTDGLIEAIAEQLQEPELLQPALKLDPRNQMAELEKLIWEKAQQQQTFDHQRRIEEDADRHRAMVEETLNSLDAGKLASLHGRRCARSDMMVMIVDDDPLARSMARSVLSKQHQIINASNGLQTITVYLENAPDVLFLDIGLPDIDGYALLEILLRMDPDAYIIMFSGRKQKEHIIRALQLGAQGYVGKPFRAVDLLNYVNKSPMAGIKQLVLNQG